MCVGFEFVQPCNEPCLPQRCYAVCNYPSLPCIETVEKPGWLSLSGSVRFGVTCPVQPNLMIPCQLGFSTTSSAAVYRDFAVMPWLRNKVLCSGLACTTSSCAALWRAVVRLWTGSSCFSLSALIWWATSRRCLDIHALVCGDKQQSRLLMLLLSEGRGAHGLARACTMSDNTLSIKITIQCKALLCYTHHSRLDQQA